jgi:3-dehydroquinate synthase
MIVDVNRGKRYKVLIENGVMEKTGTALAASYRQGTKVLIVSDTNVFPLYGQRIRESAEKAGLKVFRYIFTAGEEQKTLATASEIYSVLAQSKFNSADVIVALGGGVAVDISAFVAATYCGGMDYIQIPTSLLAQIDSSVYTGAWLNLQYGKDLVGASGDPRAVITDPSVLKTLPKEVYADGIGVLIKYACLSGRDLFEEVESGRALTKIDETIRRCIEIKRDLLEGDKGESTVLEFGDKFAESVEVLHNYKDISHGHAVSIGMVMASKIGESMNLTKSGTTSRISELLKNNGLPVEDDRFTFEEIVENTSTDKSGGGKNISIVMLSEIGKAFVHSAERNYMILRCKIMEEQKKHGQG